MTTVLKYGETIKKARKAADLTQQELADELGLTRNYIALIEADKRVPSVDNFIKICRKLNISSDEEFINGPKLKQDVRSILEKYNASDIINEIKRILEKE